jgi:hypothetical protein
MTNRTDEIYSASLDLDSDVHIVLLLVELLTSNAPDREKAPALLSRAADMLHDSNARLQAAIDAPAA